MEVIKRFFLVASVSFVLLVGILGVIFGEPNFTGFLGGFFEGFFYSEKITFHHICVVGSFFVAILGLDFALLQKSGQSRDILPLSRLICVLSYTPFGRSAAEWFSIDHLTREVRNPGLDLLTYRSKKVEDSL